MVSDGKIVVYLSTSEEAQWNTGVDNSWTFVDPVGKILTVLTEADASMNNMMQKATVTGTDFPSLSSQISLYINGVEQQTISSSTTTAVFLLNDIKSGDLENFYIYLPDGLPEDTDNFTTQTLTPTFYGFLNTEGSAGGGTMIFGGTGIGSETDLSTIDLLFSSDSFATPGVPLCEEALVAGTVEGTFSCLIGQREITSSDEIRLQVGATIVACINPGMASMCTYEALIANSPQVTSFSIDDSKTITILGLNFQDMDNNGFEPGILIDDTSSEADSALVAFQTQILSDTEIVVKFQWGVPRFTTPKAIYLGFQDASLRVEVAYQSTTPYTIASNPLDFGNIFPEENLVCSFEGGCKYRVLGEGLSAELRPGQFRTNNNRIEFCGRICEMDWDESNEFQAVCTIPHLPTRNSVAMFDISSIADVLLDAEITASTPSEVGKLTDSSLLVEYSDSGSTCFIDI